MLSLPNVTLICVETQAHELARVAMNDCVSKANFGDVIVYSDKPELINAPGARYIEVPNWPDKLQHGFFYYSEAAHAITTSHALLIEWDAGIRDPSMWRDEFLAYDFIGAPWPGRRAGQWQPPDGLSVGNGGFMLISKKLAEIVYARRHERRADSDISLCKHRREYEAAGAVWAPESVAYDFSFEHGDAQQRLKSSFGYHDIFNWPLALNRDEVIRRTRLVMENRYIKEGTTKLSALGGQWPWVREAIGPSFLQAEMQREAPHTRTQRARILPPGVRPGNPLHMIHRRGGVRA